MNCRTPGIFALTIFVAGAACGAALAAGTVELPSRKSGHWEIRMSTDMPAGVPETVVDLCVDAATDRQMMEQGLSLTSEMCPQREMKREGDRIVIDAVCNIGPVKTTSRTVISGDFQSAYTMKITGDIGGLPAGAGGNAGEQKTSMTQHARWMSASCPDGLKPGDIKMPGGIRINMKDMMDKLHR